MILISIVIPYKICENSILFWNQTRNSSDELNLKFEFPGGKIEGNETSSGAAVREVAEEVGLIIEPHHLQLFKNYSFSNDLSLFVHLYEDTQGIFEKQGFHSKEYYLSQIDKIMPNNIVIFNEVFTYLQHVKA